MRDIFTKANIHMYNKIAQKYSKVYSNYWKDIDKKYIDKFLKFLPKDSMILDAGCGSCPVGGYFVQKGYKVIGIDLSKKMLSIAKENNKAIKLLNMDIRNLKFQKDYFDGIYCAYALTYVPIKDTDKTVKGFLEVLKNNGILFLSLLEGKGERKVKEELSPSDSLNINLFTKGQIVSTLEDNKFKILYCKVYKPKLHEASNNKVIFIIAGKD